MISINDVLADRFFYNMTGFTQAAGKVTSISLWNPEDSGVHIAVRQAFIYASPYTAFNIKWRSSTPSGTLYGNRNSMSLKHDTATLAKSKGCIVVDKTGPYAPQADGSNYVLMPIDRNPVYDFRLEVPPVLEPGTGLIWYPDTSIALSWTHSMVWEEQAIE